MVTVDIRGKEFPLCLTVAALDSINSKCGGLKAIGKFLDGEDAEGVEHFSRMMCNTSWILSLLIREGEEARLACARMDGEPAERHDLPDLDMIGHLLTVAGAGKYRMAVIEAVNESMHQEIEALYPKNVKSAEQE